MAKPRGAYIKHEREGWPCINPILEAYDPLTAELHARLMGVPRLILESATLAVKGIMMILTRRFCDKAE